jgi:hypothetical protein
VYETRVRACVRAGGRACIIVRGFLHNYMGYAPIFERMAAPAGVLCMLRFATAAHPYMCMRCVCVCVCLCLCMCVCERERERAGECVRVCACV